MYQNKEFGEGQHEKLREISKKKKKANLINASFKESKCSPTSSYSQNGNKSTKHGN